LRGIILKRQSLALCLLTLSAPLAADLNVDTPLSFGEIVVRSNTSASTVTVHRNGAFQSTNHILIIKPGTPGVFTIDGLPPYTTINLSVDLPASSSMNYPQTAQFTITAVDIPSTVNLGPAGSTQFKMGATLTTSGNPVNQYYSGAEYLIFLNLNLDY
jgi:hypothetical protein